MKIPTRCLFCHSEFVKKKTFPENDNFYNMECQTCPTKKIIWSTTSSVSFLSRETLTSPMYVTWIGNPNDLKSKYINEPINIVLYFDNLTVEFDVKEPKKMRIWKIDFAPTYTSEHLLTAPLPQIDLTTITEEEFLQKIKTFIAFQ